MEHGYCEKKGNGYYKHWKCGTFIDYCKNQRKGKKEQMCNFCGDFCLREDLPGHYSQVHKAGVWTNQTFPGTKAYKTVDNKQFCLICWHENNSPTIPYFNDIFHHFQTFHSIHPSKFRMYEEDRRKKKRKKKVQAATVKISNKVPQGGELKKSKDTESNANLNVSVSWSIKFLTLCVTVLIPT